MSGKTAAGDLLIERLLDNPELFFKQGASHALLNEILAGFPMRVLRPLLAHADETVKKIAVYIASELGVQGQVLMPDVIPLLDSSDRYVVYHALDCVASWSLGRCLREFGRVASAMGHDDAVIRVRAMELMRSADHLRLVGARAFFESGAGGRESHADGLTVLVSGNIEPDIVLRMVTDPRPMTRRYGAVAMARLGGKWALLRKYLISSQDEDLRTFEASMSA